MDSATAALLQEAVLLHRQGALAEAAERYAQVLRGDPANADALYALAQISCQQGRLAEGVDFARRALVIDPQRARAHNLLGLALARLGQAGEALASFDAAIACAPELADAHGNRGDVLAELGRPAEAVASYDCALQIVPGSIENWCNRGAALHDLGRYVDALASYDRVIALKPDFAEVHCIRGNALAQLGRHRDAIIAYDRALALRPNDPDALNNRGNVQSKLGRHDEALASFGRALAVAPDHVNALLSGGDVLRKLGRQEEALASYRRALAIKPDHVDALIGCGAALIELMRCEEALTSVETALAVEPNNVDALNNRGFVLNALNRRDEALASYDRALRIEPNHAEALNNRGVALSDLGLHEAAIASFDQVLVASPDHAGALCNRAKALNTLHRYDEALASTERALAIDPRYADALFTRGNTLVKLQRDGEAIACFERALTIDPRHPHALPALANRYLANCDWNNSARIADELDNRIADGKSVINPFILFGFPVGPADLLACTRRYVEREIPRVSAGSRDRAKHRSDKIRLAYLSADFHQHATAYLAAGLFERHDRSRFEITGISFGPDDKSDIRARLVRSFDNFHDVSSQSDGDIATLLRERDVDIAVDLKGHTEDARPGILASRPAPLQVSYLGFPSTTGMDVIDYVIADRIILPFDQQPYYTEKIVHLPESYQVNDGKRQIASRTPVRSEAGLPDHVFVFCCFNGNWKINARMFDIWMRLLRAVDGSVLWLFKSSNLAPANLRKEAQARGVDPARLVFAPFRDQADHLARLKCADLFLDTLPCNAHTTASDALWAALPVLTCIGNTFAGRVAASLLHAVGLPELVTDNLDDYEALALKLATDRALLQSIRHRLEQNRLTAPLFDTNRSRRHIERAYTTMWEIYRRGESPRSFSVEPV